MKKKRTFSNDKEEYCRPCREVVCPFCNHRFMWLGDIVSVTPPPTYYYKHKETGEYAPDTTCPVCGEEIIIEPNVLLGVAPCEGKYKTEGLRGI